MTRIALSKSKGQGHQAALLTAVLARQVAAAVGVGTCWPWETAATLPSARQREALRRPRGSRGARAYRGGRPPTACFVVLQTRCKHVHVPVPHTTGRVADRTQTEQRTEVYINNFTTEKKQVTSSANK